MASLFTLLKKLPVTGMLRRRPLRPRNSGKALIIQDGKLLVIKCRDTTNPIIIDDYYAIPGGGQEHGESLIDAVKRECLEEINVQVEVGDLIFVRDYIGKNHNFAYHAHMHQLDFYFLCTIIAGEPGIGHIPDTDQLSVAWLPLSELETCNLWPQSLRKILPTLAHEIDERVHPVYLGDVN